LTLYTEQEDYLKKVASIPTTSNWKTDNIDKLPWWASCFCPVWTIYQKCCSLSDSRQWSWSVYQRLLLAAVNFIIHHKDFCLYGCWKWSF